MADYFDFSSDKINIFIFVIDSSDSMKKDKQNVKDGLRDYKKSFEGFIEANSIAVSICKFNCDFYPGEFRPIKEFTTDYNTSGTTALYYSIVEAEKHLNKYVKDVIQRTGCIPRVTFILLSDGEPCDDRRYPDEAKKSIENMNYAGYTTVFIAFGSAISSEFGKKLGFMSTIDVRDRSTLVNFLGVELSNSCKEQSRSLKALGADFFSKVAGNGNSDEYSHTTAQALEDDSWMTDI